MKEFFPPLLPPLKLRPELSILISAKQRAMPGPRPKPTKLKLLEGNPGKRPINHSEPKPEAKIPNCPSWLDDVAKAEWKRVIPDLAGAGLVTTIDRSALAAYCVAFSTAKSAEEIIQREGLTFTMENGYTQQHPAVGIRNNALEMMRKFMAEFGMTPASRSKIKLETPDGEDEVEEFLSRKRA